MSQADALLNSISTTVATHAHPVVDSDKHYIVDPISRVINNAVDGKNTLIQYDHDSERFTFEVPRYVDGHDMSLCNATKIHYINIEVIEEELDSNKVTNKPKEPKTNEGVYEVRDIHVDPNNRNSVLCSWLISRNATQLAGTLCFLIQYACADYEGHLTYEWHTDIYTNVLVNTGMNNSMEVVANSYDILDQWKAELFGAVDSKIAEIEVASAEQQALIAAKAEETLDTIPADYTETHYMAETAFRTKADAIVCEVEGESMYLRDCSDIRLQNLRVFGKTTQTVTTGKNLFDATTATAYYALTETGALEDSSTLATSDYISVTPGSTYYLWGTKSHRGKFYDSDRVVVSSLFDFNPSTGVVLSIPANVYFVRFSFAMSETKLQLEAGTSPTTYELYSGGSPSPSPDYPRELKHVEETTVSLVTKNLLNASSPSSSINGITYTVNDDLSITLNGTAGGISKIYFEVPGGLAVGEKYVLSGCPSGGDISGYSLWLNNIGTNTDNGDGVTFTFTEGLELRPCIRIAPDTVVNNLTFYPMIRHASIVDATYEPYKGQTMTVSAPNGLRGVPVKANGNYTDANGQQWITDEINFDRGVYIKRVRELNIAVYENWNMWEPDIRVEGVLGFYHYIDDKITSNNALCTIVPCNTSKAWGGKGIGCMTNTSADKHYVTVSVPTSCLADVSTDSAAISSFMDLLHTTQAKMVIAVTPTETPLSDLDIHDYKKLHTNYPNTFVYNSDNVHMEVSYAADTEIFMQNQPKIMTEEQVSEALNIYLSENPIVVPTDEHLNKLIYAALGVVENGTY